MFSILKKQKAEKLGFDLQNSKNQKALIAASLEYKIPLITKGPGIYFVDMKYIKGDSLSDFLKCFMKNSICCHQGIIDRDDPKYDYILIYDLKEVMS